MNRPKLHGIEAGLTSELRAHIVVHRGKPCRIADAFERLEVELRQIHTVPIECSGEPAHSRRARPGTLAVRQFHQLPPIELRTLADCRSLPPFWVICPET